MRQCSADLGRATVPRAVRQPVCHDTATRRTDFKSRRPRLDLDSNTTRVVASTERYGLPVCLSPSEVLWRALGKHSDLFWSNQMRVLDCLTGHQTFRQLLLLLLLAAVWSDAARPCQQSGHAASRLYGLPVLTD